MKTAISMPDDVFERVDDYARRHRLSRSEVFVIAARELLDAETRAALTAQINDALQDAGATDDDFLRAAARDVATGTEW